nr:MAG TPA: hypothetical protein [Caudoviricetes sp.]DAR91978.1 MAG TPA: hypothetical protein [Bacteriophage sp.]
MQSRYFQIYITIMTDSLSSLSFSRYREISFYQLSLRRLNT